MIKKKPRSRKDACENEPDRSEPLPEDETGKSRGYYYDDAHGYERFDPESDPDEEDEDEAAS